MVRKDHAQAEAMIGGVFAIAPEDWLLEFRAGNSVTFCPRLLREYLGISSTSLPRTSTALRRPTRITTSTAPPFP
ncbi:hypothetical protein IMZ48_46415 [Candidatus Bathyarchaeota archaeon]|nr:hypothetical protein [Candidatus Bathyarchaeota archaeon]